MSPGRLALPNGFALSSRLFLSPKATARSLEACNVCIFRKVLASSSGSVAQHSQSLWTTDKMLHNSKSMAILGQVTRSCQFGSSSGSDGKHRAAETESSPEAFATSKGSMPRVKDTPSDRSAWSSLSKKNGPENARAAGKTKSSTSSVQKKKNRMSKHIGQTSQQPKTAGGGKNAASFPATDLSKPLPAEVQALTDRAKAPDSDKQTLNLHEHARAILHAQNRCQLTTANAKHEVRSTIVSYFCSQEDRLVRPVVALPSDDPHFANAEAHRQQFAVSLLVGHCDPAPLAHYLAQHKIYMPRLVLLCDMKKAAEHAWPSILEAFNRHRSKRSMDPLPQEYAFATLEPKGLAFQDSLQSSTQELNLFKTEMSYLDPVACRDAQWLHSLNAKFRPLLALLCTHLTQEQAQEVALIGVDRFGFNVLFQSAESKGDWRNLRFSFNHELRSHTHVDTQLEALKDQMQQGLADQGVSTSL